MASRKQTLEREYQTYTVRPLSISTTTKPKLSYQVLGEHHKDRAEERAARSDAKIAMLESELGGVNKTMKSLSNQGDENGKREEDLEEEIKDVKERFRNAEVNAEMAERTVQKLQTEIDRMETALLAEKTKKTRMEEDMEHLVQSIGDI